MHLAGGSDADPSNGESQDKTPAKKGQKTHDHNRSYNFVPPSFADMQMQGRESVGAWGIWWCGAGGYQKRTLPKLFFSLLSQHKAVSARVAHAPLGHTNTPLPLLTARHTLTPYAQGKKKRRNKERRIPRTKKSRQWLSSSGGCARWAAGRPAPWCGSRPTTTQGSSWPSSRPPPAAPRRSCGERACPVRALLAAHRPLPRIARRRGRRVPAVPRVRARRSLADEAARNGAASEPAIRAYAADVARGWRTSTGIRWCTATSRRGTS